MYIYVCSKMENTFTWGSEYMYYLKNKGKLFKNTTTNMIAYANKIFLHP